MAMAEHETPYKQVCILMPDDCLHAARRQLPVRVSHACWVYATQDLMLRTTIPPLLHLATKYV